MLNSIFTGFKRIVPWMFKQKLRGSNDTTAQLRCDLPEWKALENHARQTCNIRIGTLFANDENRFEKFSQRLGPVFIDYSKQRISEETIGKLFAYARACNLEGWRQKMFDGEIINISEKRAVLHTALRADSSAEVMLDGENVVTQVQAVLNKMKDFSTQIRSEKRFTDIVNIGIGGSDLGAAMAYEGLKPYVSQDITVHYVSNIDPSQLCDVLRKVDPKRTLFIVVSKSFTTMDTMTNAYSAREWLCKKIGDDAPSEHFVAVSQNVELAQEFGIKEENIFPIWDWVGGRFSLWSSVGLALCIALGYEQFSEMLNGAKAMDDHFKSEKLEKNLPVILGLIGIWNRNFLGYKTLAIVPYNQYLHHMPAYMQQLDMESNGKSIDRNGQRVPYATGPVIFGTPGTNAQHSFFQSLHQGTNIIPCDFIASVKSRNDLGDHQTKLLANMFAQSKAFMEGEENDDPNKSFEGNRPSTTILLDELTPYSLGMLIALYEHKIFVQGVLWNINSFDQGGVELGKTLSNQIIPLLLGNNDIEAMDSSTKNLIEITKKIS
jgi:glucose-6-phosphate isomerase